MKRKRVFVLILSLLFSFFMLFGSGFLFYDNCSLIFKNLLHIILSIVAFSIFFFIFFFIINKLFLFFDNFKKNQIIIKFF